MPTSYLLYKKAKEKDKLTVLIAAKPGLATSLKHAVDHVEMIKSRNKPGKGS